MDREWVRERAAEIEEVRNGLVSIELADAAGGALEVAALWSEKERFRGHAGRAMRALAGLADEAGVELVLVPRWLAYETDHLDGAEADELERLNRRRLDNDELAQWYGRLGFGMTGETDGDRLVMRRPPSVPGPAARL